jgi:hypothetical protein
MRRPHGTSDRLSSGGWIALASLALALVLFASPGLPAVRPLEVPLRTDVPTAYVAGVPVPSVSSPLGGWSNLTAGLPNSPGARYGSSAAWDNATGEAILFGGLSPTVGLLRSTWTFANGGWHVSGPNVPNATNAPTSRFGAAMAYDPALKATILFGGRDSEGGLLSDTWSFDGTNWSNLSSNIAGAPPSRVNASLAYDPSLGSLVLFGGRSPSTVFSDTWEFNGADWTSVGSVSPNATNTPPARYGATLAYSSALGGLVLFGGTGHQNASYLPLNDTWEFNSGGWQPLHPADAPSARSFASVATLPDGDELVFGGIGATTLLSDTWTFNGTDWTNATASVGPPPSARSAAALVPVAVGSGTGYVLLFGGLSASGPVGDSWAVGANAIVATRGVASPSALDENQTTTLSVVAFGPSSPLAYSWSSLPAGCVTADTPTLVCTPSAQGRFTPTVTISDGSDAASLVVPLSLQVNTPPVITGVLVTPYPLVLGTGNVSLTVQASGGTGKLQYAFAGLPPGCNSTDTALLVCPPKVVGTWTVEVTVVDSANGSASRSATVVVTATGPSKSSHLLTVLLSPLGLTALLVGVGLLLMIAYTVLRRRRLGRTPPAPTPGTKTSATSPPQAAPGQRPPPS